MTDRPTKRLSPKQRWLASTPPGGLSQQSEPGRWTDQTDHPFFQAQCERALAEMVTRCKCSDPATAVVVGLKLEGAKEVLNILVNLGEPDKASSAKSTANSLTPI